jgi:hypothetical protein
MPILFTNIRALPSVDNGVGGMPFAHQPAHPGIALVGLRLRVGDWIDQVSPIYAELLEDGTLGPEIHGPTFGGFGGQPTDLHCQPGHVVTGLQTRSGHYVDGIRLRQTPWDGSLSGESTWTRWVVGGHLGGVERVERLAEPQGRTVAFGVVGRSGHYLDNFALVTGEIHRVASTTLTENTNRKGRESRDSSMMTARS